MLQGAYAFQPQVDLPQRTVQYDWVPPHHTGKIVSSLPGVSRSTAKEILVWCYQADIIGPYRRLSSGWKIRMPDDELILDDLQVIQKLGHKAGVSSSAVVGSSKR